MKPLKSWPTKPGVAAEPRTKEANNCGRQKTWLKVFGATIRDFLFSAELKQTEATKPIQQHQIESHQNEEREAREKDTRQIIPVLANNKFQVRCKAIIR